MTTWPDCQTERRNLPCITDTDLHQMLFEQLQMLINQKQILEALK